MLKLSVLVITKNCSNILPNCLSSVVKIADEIIVVDNGSSDDTIKIANKFGARVFVNKDENLGKLRLFGLRKCAGEWVLVIDSDEVAPKALTEEIMLLINKPNIQYHGFKIQFQNHFLGRSINYGGENYSKLCLFKKKQAKIQSLLVHEKIEVEGKKRMLKHKMLHFSYRSLWQTYRKFTDYSFREAKQKKFLNEKSSLKKVFIFPVHMFWARFIKDKGYKDGFFRVPLDFGFAYMEFLTYLLLFFL